MFSLHEQLKADTIEIRTLQLSRLVLMNDCSVPWFILVPEQIGITEIHELDFDDRQVLIEEIALISSIVQELYNPDKINVGMLGNIVPQLHIHVIGRFRDDRAWPGPIWGSGPSVPYSPELLAATLEHLRQRFRRRRDSD
ncbi:MAG TPA: HIT family protein [Dissulfurispiraceae bacterium]|nr:HIT family protein [Dissulfurispiraceae bacterium]